MKVSFDKLMSAINTYIDRDLMPVTKSMGSTALERCKQFFFGFGVGVIKEQANVVVTDFIHGNISHIFKIVDEEENIDVDILYRAAKYSMHQVSYVDVMGVTINEADIDKIYSYLR